MDKDCPRMILKLAAYILFGGQFIKFADNYKNRWTIMKFREQFIYTFYLNVNPWTIVIIHGQLNKYTDNFIFFKK